MAKRKAFNAAQGLFAPTPAQDPFFSPPDAQEVCTGSVHTMDAQEVKEAPAALEKQTGPALPSPAAARIDEATPTRTPAGYGNTQGRKGKRMPRINMAFSPENHAWLKQNSNPERPMTEIVNELIDQARRNSHGH